MKYFCENSSRLSIQFNLITVGKSLNLILDIGIKHKKIIYSPELLEFIKYGPFLILWYIFCRNPWKIEYENEVCFEACRMPNFF